MTDSSGPGKLGQEPGNPDIHIPDPVQLARDFAEIAERSQRLVLEFLQRQHSDGVDMATPFNLGQAFMEMTQRLMADPSRLVQAQLSLWQDYLKLWQTTTQRLMGGTAEPVIEASAGDRRFKDSAWTENAVFDYIKQSYLLTARWMQSTVKQVDGLDDKTAKKVDFYTRQFVDAIAPSNFVADQSRGAARHHRERRREPGQGPRQPARGSRARQGPPDDQDDRPRRVQGRREHRGDAGQGRLPERSDPAHPVRADHRDGASGGRC